MMLYQLATCTVFTLVHTLQLHGQLHIELVVVGDEHRVVTENHKKSFRLVS